MEFLRRAYKVRRRRVKLEEFLLLAMRCLIIALFGAALAQPFFDQDSAASGIGEARTHRIVVLDDSLSMKRSPGSPLHSKMRANSCAAGSATPRPLEPMIRSPCFSPLALASRCSMACFLPRKPLVRCSRNSGDLQPLGASGRSHGGIARSRKASRYCRQQLSQSGCLRDFRPARKRLGSSRTTRRRSNATGIDAAHLGANGERVGARPCG